MRRFKFEKLVRDKIIEQQSKSGARPKHRTLSKAEHKEHLIEKVIEEAQEILEASGEKLAGEVADVQQALDDLKELLGITHTEVSKAQAIKNEKNGAFKKGIYVESVEVAEDDKWVEYYLKNPDRYPEIT